MGVAAHASSAVFNLEDADAVEADLVAAGDFGLNGTEEALADILYSALGCAEAFFVEFFFYGSGDADNELDGGRCFLALSHGGGTSERN